MSYLEWVQDLQFFFWPVDEINRKLENLMLKAFESVMESSQQVQGSFTRSGSDSGHSEGS